MKNLTNIKLHGVLGEGVGKENWKLAIKSVGEAIRAIEVLSKRKLYKFLNENDRKGLKYQIIINGRPFESKEELKAEDLEGIKNSELVISFKKLDSIDIIPVIEGAGGQGGSIGAIVAGVLLIIVGVVLAFTPLSAISPYLIVAGIGLIAAGVINLISQPPEFDDFREIKNGGRVSYLFSGPQNTTREGGPVPVGYGRMLVGSQVIAASYEVSHVNADENALTT